MTFFRYIQPRWKRSAILASMFKPDSYKCCRHDSGGTAFPAIKHICDPFHSGHASVSAGFRSPFLGLSSWLGGELVNIGSIGSGNASPRQRRIGHVLESGQGIPSLKYVDVQPVLPDSFSQIHLQSSGPYVHTPSHVHGFLTHSLCTTKAGTDVHRCRLDGGGTVPTFYGCESLQCYTRSTRIGRSPTACDPFFFLRLCSISTQIQHFLRIEVDAFVLCDRVVSPPPCFSANPISFRRHPIFFQPCISPGRAFTVHIGNVRKRPGAFEVHL
ncbi:hypothetical protein C8R43DRAFT_506728 [Mycena crocata]|nr:hypothetical protein C8R43DRAFT_506728 [Mycena crocata]